jgi:hypothetical protein
MAAPIFGLGSAAVGLGGGLLRGGLGAIRNLGSQIGGLLSRTGSFAKRAALPAAGAAGIYGINKNLEELGDDIQTAGGRGGLFSAGAGGGAAGTNMANAASATSILSDADSSDPVVRQLQDIERVLQSIKGDTATIVSGMDKMGAANNGNAARNMFGSGDKPVGDLKSLLPALILGAMAAQKTGAGGEDKNADGIPDNEQDSTQATIDSELQELAGKAKPIQTVAKTAKTAAGVVMDAGELGVKAVVNANKALSEVTVPKREMKPLANVSTIDGKPYVPPEPETPKSVPGSSATPDKPPAGSVKAKIAAAIPKKLTSVVAKAVPVLGAMVSGGLAIDKLIKGDGVGALMEVTSIFLPSAVGTPLDLTTAARDIYMDVHGADPFSEEERNSEGYGERWKEVRDAVAHYAANLFKQASEIPTVEARPKAPMRMTARTYKKHQEETAEWDEKYGAFFDDDGVMKPEVHAEMLEREAAGDFGPPKPKPLEGNFGDRLIKRAERDLIEPTKEVFQDFEEGFDRAVPFKMNADTVEITTESAVSSDAQDQANRIGTEVGGMVAVNQKQGERAVPVGQPVQVSVASAKTSFPQDNASLRFINDRGSYLT